MTTARDIVTEALRECGALGLGQTASSQDTQEAFTRLNQMIAQWAVKRWLVYRLCFASWTSTGSTSFTLGPTGTVTTTDDGITISPRPDRLETGCFVRQVNVSAPNQPDTPLTLLESKEDYSRIGLKSLTAFPSWIFYDPTDTNGTVYPWPIPTASIYKVFVCFKRPFPAFASLDTTITFPASYEAAMLYQLAIRLRSKYSIPKGVNPDLDNLAKDAMVVVRGSNVAIARLQPDVPVGNMGLYNIYSDRNYST